MTLLLVLLWSAAAASQAPPPPGTPPPPPLTAEELYAKGVQLHQAGDILGAIEAYQEALEQEPRRVDARSNLGAAYARLGRFEDAAREYRRALEVEPGQVQVRFNLGLALYKSARLEEAVKELEQVRALDPTHSAALLLLADGRLQLGDDAAVVALLEPHESALREDRLYAYLLGHALLRLNQPDKAQVYIDRLFKDGDTAQAQLLMGLAHLRGKDPRTAAAEFERAARLDPKLPGVHSLLGRALLDSGRRAEGIEAFRRELAGNPIDFDANLFLGLLLKDDDRLDEAGDYLRRASRLRPQDARVLYGLGGLHLAAGRIEEAEQALKAVTVAVPDYRQAHVLLATVYYRQKKKELGDQERAIVVRLQKEQQARELSDIEVQGGGPVYRGEDLPPDPGAADAKPKPPSPHPDGSR
jgi:tetratricopeptide (TPR) repeat protein